MRIGGEEREGGEGDTRGRKRKGGRGREEGQEMNKGLWMELKEQGGTRSPQLRLITVSTVPPVSAACAMYALRDRSRAEKDLREERERERMEVR